MAKKKHRQPKISFKKLSKDVLPGEPTIPVEVGNKRYIIAQRNVGSLYANSVKT